MNTPLNLRSIARRITPRLTTAFATATLAAALTLNPAPLPAALLLPAVQHDMVMVVDGIPGDSTLLKGAIEISGFSQSMYLDTSDIGTGTGAGAGKVSMSDITITKNIDKSSPLLMQACATGKTIPKVTLYVRRSDPEKQAYLVVTLENVIVSSIQAHAGDGSVYDSELGTTSDASTTGFGLETISLNFTKISESVLGEGDPVSFAFDLSKLVAY